MKKEFRTLSGLLIVFLCCAFPASSAPKEVGLLKNWDSVNRLLGQYRKKSVAVAIDDFGENYIEDEESLTFYSPSEESSIRFSVKKGNIQSFSYDGSYADLILFLDTIPKFKDSEIQTVANTWLGFSPKVLKETFGSFVLSSTDKLITVGASESACIEFVISSSFDTDSSSSEPYIDEARVRGSYDELKDYLVKVPKGSVPQKKIRQRN